MKKSNLMNHDKNKHKIQIAAKVERRNEIFKRSLNDKHNTMTGIYT